jgi:hypothetical protein
MEAASGLVVHTEVVMERIGRAIVVVAAILPLASCGRSDSLGFTPVEGRVTFDGKPLERGEIRFVPDASQGGSGPQSIGSLGPGGLFVLRGPGGRIGAVPGQHRVYLSMPAQDGPPTPPIEVEGKAVPRDEAENPQPISGTGPGKQALPGRYLAAETSGLTGSVTRGEPARFEFELTSSTVKK